MSHREMIREQHRRREKRERLIIIGVVVIVALVITFLLVWPNIQPVGNIVVPTFVSMPTDKVPAGTAAAGDPSAPVKLDIWEDFQCPACQNFTLNIEPDLVSKYVDTGKVYLVFHPFSFIDTAVNGNESHAAAQAAYCALDQGKFWQYHDMLFNNQSASGENSGAFTDRRLAAYAEKISLDMSQFNDCYNSGKYKQQVIDDFNAGVKLGIDSTPSFFVNDKKIELKSSYDELTQAIDNALQGK
jgi:protein-disulfide isomerase